MKAFCFLLGTAALMLAAAPVKADVVYSVNNINEQYFNGAPTLVDLNGPVAGGTTVQFTTPSAGKYIVTFYAECAIAGDANSWADVDIIVDPAGSAGPTVLYPSRDDNAMCSGGTNQLNGWVSAVVPGFVNLPKGTHKLSVRVTGVGSNSIRLDDLALVVQR